MSQLELQLEMNSESIKKEAEESKDSLLDFHRDVYIKREPVDDLKDVLSTDELDLYADHEIKEEMVVGPVVLQFSDIAQASCVQTTQCCNKESYISHTNSAANNSVQSQMNFFSFQENSMHHEKHKRKFVCDFCKKQFRLKSHLIEHLCTHTGEKPFTCDFCNKGFTSKQKVKRHLITHTAEKPFICDICNKGLSSKSSLSLHLKIHTALKPFRCDICEKCFNRKCNLDAHILRSEEIPMTCNLCKKQFCIKRQYNSHLKIHTEEKPFNCNICTKGLTTKANLKFHSMTHNSHNAVKPFKCNICEKSFIRRYKLTEHLRNHANEIPLVCNICICKKKQYYNHLLFHTGEKPFICDICSKGFDTKKGVQLHINMHYSGRIVIKSTVTSKRKKGFNTYLKNQRLNKELTTMC